MSFSVKVRIGIVLLISIPSILGIGIIAANQLNLASLAGDNIVVQQVIVNKTLFVDASRDAVDFEQISLEGDILTLKISYTGGQKNHTFELIGTGEYMESNPIQIAFVLSHDANGDLGESSITKILSFDLKPLIEDFFQVYSFFSFPVSLKINLEGYGDIILTLGEPLIS